MGTFVVCLRPGGREKNLETSAHSFGQIVSKIKSVVLSFCDSNHRLLGAAVLC